MLAKCTGVIVAVVTAITISGCTGQSGSTDQLGNLSNEIWQDPAAVESGIKPDLEQLTAKLPPIPLDVGREPSNLIVDGKPASETYNSAESTQIAGDALILNSQEGALCWAIWQFNPGPGTATDLDVQISTQENGLVYLALADYTKDRWNFFGPFSEGTTVPLDNASNRSPAGNIFVAAMTCDGDVAMIADLGLHYENGWITTTVVSEGNTGKHTSMAVIAGRPAICFYGADNKLQFIRASNIDGTAWDTPNTIIEGVFESYIEDSVSLAEIEGKPAVCFPDNLDSLDFARGADPDGTTWSIRVINGSGNYSYTSLTEVNGYPAVSFYDNVMPEGLRYCRASEATGELAWGDVQLLTTGFGIGWYTSLRVESGSPIISYSDTFTDQIKVIGATDANGSSWNPPQVVDTLVDPASVDASGEIVNFGLAVSYGDSPNKELKYSWYDIQAAEWQHVVVDNDCDVPSWISLAVVGGNPAISYYAFSPGYLKYVEAANATGSTWEAPVIVDNAGKVGAHSSLVEVDGRPAISYYDIDNGDLKYAIRSY